MNNSKQIIENKFIKTDLEKGMVDMIANRKLSAIIPILIKGFREKCYNISPIQLMENYQSKREFFAPSNLDLRKINKYNELFLESLPDKYMAKDISPINPLGTNSIITKVSQDVSLTTIRGSEVNSDPTTALTLEAAYMRKEKAKCKNTFFDIVNLATIHRVLRLQNFDKSKGYMQHFNLFGIVSSGRAQGEKCEFLINIILEHIKIWLDFIKKLNENNFLFKNISVNISHVALIESLIDNNFLKREIINLNSLNDNYDLFKENKIIIPSTVKNINELNKEIISKYKLENIIPLFNIISEKISEFSNQYEDINFCIDFNRKAGLGYYDGYCYHIFAENIHNDIIQLADGGTVNWNTKLLSDKKELSITSGFGAELIQKLFEIGE